MEEVVIPASPTNVADQLTFRNLVAAIDVRIREVEVPGLVSLEIAGVLDIYSDATEADVSLCL